MNSSIHAKNKDDIPTNSTTTCYALLARAFARNNSYKVTSEYYLYSLSLANVNLRSNRSVCSATVLDSPNLQSQRMEIMVPAVVYTGGK